MVSFENGQYILRYDERLQHKTRSRRTKLRRVVLVAGLFSIFQFVSKRRQPQGDLSLLRAARDANVKSTMSFQDDDGTDGEVRSVAHAQYTDGDSIHLNEKFLDYLHSLEPIPKLVHIFFPDKDYWRKKPPIPFVENSILMLMKLNPNWKVTVYDDEMIDNIIRNAADAGLIPTEESNVLIGSENNGLGHKAHIVERSDLARMILMYTQGGLYLDADRLVSKRIDDVIQPSTRLCLPTYDDVNFCQDLMVSRSTLSSNIIIS